MIPDSMWCVELVDAPGLIAHTVVYILTCTDTIGQALGVSLIMLTVLATKKIKLSV